MSFHVGITTFVIDSNMLPIKVKVVGERLSWLHCMIDTHLYIRSFVSHVDLGTKVCTKSNYAYLHTYH